VRPKGKDGLTDRIHALLVGLDPSLQEQLDESFEVSTVASLPEAGSYERIDVVVMLLDSGQTLDAIRTLRSSAPGAAILVVTDPEHAADGTIAMHAGAEDHLILGQIAEGLLPRAIRYAVAVRRLRQEVTAQDETTGLPNLRGFASIAEHHLKMADRSGRPVVFVFVRLDDLARLTSEDAARADEVVRASADVVLEAVRSSDVPARVADDTFCVLLTGDAEGAEGLVLSRLVEAIASRAGGDSATALSVGSALYEPGSGTTLEAILQAAGRGLSANSSGSQ
jgi:diguanylate cyclase (GGDEF)-like protein